jgi:hypothetical protein
MSEAYTLTLVLGASALAIALLVALNVFLGGWTPSRLGDLTAAGRRIAVDVLGFEASAEGVLDADKSAALVFETGRRRVGLAACLGDRIAVRALRPGDLRGVETQSSVLVVRLDDYTLPQIRLRFAEPALAERWADELHTFMRQNMSEPVHA